MIQTILFATDLGVYTPYVLQHVAAMAGTAHAQVIILHAVNSLDKITASFPGEGDINKRQLLDSIRDAVVDTLSDEFFQMSEELNCVDKIIVEEGEPAELILAICKRYQCDMIILGKHGAEFDKKLRVGSVAHQVLERAKVPVYTVPMLPQTPNPLHWADSSKIPRI